METLFLGVIPGFAPLRFFSAASSSKAASITALGLVSALRLDPVVLIVEGINYP
jgi:hypothetical protein